MPRAAFLDAIKRHQHETAVNCWNFIHPDLIVLLFSKMLCRHVSYNWKCVLCHTEFTTCEGKVKALRLKDEFVDQVSDALMAGVLLDCTCFYAEQGGQLFDNGFMTKLGDEVRNTLSGQLFTILKHIGRQLEGGRVEGG